MSAKWWRDRAGGCKQPAEGVYLNNGLVIDAPDLGQVVKIEPYRHPRDDYVGASRPSNRQLFHLMQHEPRFDVVLLSPLRSGGCTNAQG